MKALLPMDNINRLENIEYYFKHDAIHPEFKIKQFALLGTLLVYNIIITDFYIIVKWCCWIVFTLHLRYMNVTVSQITDISTV